MQAGRVTWTRPGVKLTRVCPLCIEKAAHRELLAAIDGFGRTQRLLQCRACGCRFYADLKPLDYEDEAAHAMVRQHYLEHGAGIEQIVRPIFEIDHAGASSLLDVGCGFGFSVIAAKHILGWRACGVEPGHYADEGRRLGTVDIRRTLLQPTTDLGDPFDLVIASEVIEHVPDPPAFVQLLRQRLTQHGVLALTTPNAEAIEPGRSPEALLQMLSPGGHLVLFTRDTLEATLRRAGFAHVRIEVRGDSLVAYASDATIRLRGEDACRVGVRSLLRHLLDHAVPASPLWNGAAYRLFASIDDGVEAWALFHRIADVWRAAFGFDVLNPATLVFPAPDAPDPVTDLPFCVGSVLFRRAQLKDTALLQTIATLRGAMAFAAQSRAKLLGAGLEDGGLRQIVVHARLHLARCLGDLVPEAEGDLFAGMAVPSLLPYRSLFDIEPDELVRMTAPRFTALIHSGQYAQAQRFAGLFSDLNKVCAALSTTPAMLLHTLFCLAILRLNGDKDVAAARPPLDRLLQMAGGTSVVAHDPHLASHFSDLALRHLALIGANTKERYAEPML